MGGYWLKKAVTTLILQLYRLFCIMLLCSAHTGKILCNQIVDCRKSYSLISDKYYTFDFIQLMLHKGTTALHWLFLYYLGPCSNSCTRHPVLHRNSRGYEIQKLTVTTAIFVYRWMWVGHLRGCLLWDQMYVFKIFLYIFDTVDHVRKSNHTIL